MAWLPTPKTRTWFNKVPNLRGMNAYVVLIRDKNDPEREPRPGLLKDPGHATRWKQMDKSSPGEWRRVIVNLLADGIPRTFNRVMVELIGMTADTAAGKNPEKGLWLGVEHGDLEYTSEAPILFRAVRAKRRTGKTVAPPKKQKEVAGYAVYDASTTHKQVKGQRVGMKLLLTAPAPQQAKEDARSWTLLTGHATVVQHKGLPVTSYNWTAEMAATYTLGWVRGETRVTDDEKTGVFYHTKPSRGATDSGYLASILWDGEPRTVWVPLTSLKVVKSTKKVAVAPAAKKPARRAKKPERITAKDITGPVLGEPEARLAQSVQEAIGLYGRGRKKR